MGKNIWIVGVAAAVLFTVSALTGYSVEPRRGEIRLHLLISVGSGLLVVFCQLWIAFYLLTTDRLVRRTVRREGLAEELLEPLAGWLVRTLPLLIPALALAVAVVALGAETYTGRLSAAAHQALGWGALAFQAAALAVEKGVLERHEALFREVDRQVSGQADSG
jgi:hypothetical protein